MLRKRSSAPTEARRLRALELCEQRGEDEHDLPEVGRGEMAHGILPEQRDDQRVAEHPGFETLEEEGRCRIR
jgi:hypothetical protein